MTTIITKHSQEPNAKPAPATLEIGELAVNTADGLLFTTNDQVNLVTIGGGGGTSGDIPNGSSYGQMLFWNAAGEPAWNVTSNIIVSLDNNVSIGGPQFSASYKFTVNGNFAVSGDSVMGNIVCNDIGADRVSVTTDPSVGNNVTRQSYTESRYALKSTAVTTNTSQTISGGKTFSAAQNFTAGCTINGAFGGLNLPGLAAPAGQQYYLKIASNGVVLSDDTFAAADAEFTDGKGLPQKLRDVLIAMATALNANPNQMAALETALVQEGL